MKCEVNCFTAFNGWRSECLASNINNNPYFEAFKDDLEKLRLLPERVKNLSKKELQIIKLSQMPREFILSPKNLKKLDKMSDEKAKEALFDLTGEESDLICRYYFPGTHDLKSDREPTQIEPIAYTPTPFTHG